MNWSITQNSSNAPPLKQLILQKASLLQLCGDVCEGEKEMETLSSGTTKPYPIVGVNPHCSHKTIRSCVSTELSTVYAGWAPLWGMITSQISLSLPSLWFPLSTGCKNWALHPQPSSQGSKPCAQSLKVIMQSPRRENWCNTFPQHLKGHNRPLLATDITYTEYTRAEM